LRFRSITSAFTVLGLVVIASACQTALQKPTMQELLAKLPALQAVASADNADRALIIAQDVRVMARDTLADRINADRSLSPEEQAQLAAFHRYDRQFTAAWLRAAGAVDVWRARGGTMPTEFSEAYALVLDILSNPNGLRDPR
jgi:cytochrome c peroxidase